MKVYSGPELPRDMVATITYAPGAHVAAVDGRAALGLWNRYFAVKPGKHPVTLKLVSCSGHPPVCTYTPGSVLSFEAEANHKYIAHGESFSNARYWIEDEGTRQVVGRYPE